MKFVKLFEDFKLREYVQLKDLPTHGICKLDEIDIIKLVDELKENGYTLMKMHDAKVITWFLDKNEIQSYNMLLWRLGHPMIADKNKKVMFLIDDDDSYDITINFNDYFEYTGSNRGLNLKHKFGL